MMKYSDEFIEEILRENVELRMQYFEYKQKAKDYEEHYYNYRHHLSKEARNKNKEQIVRERDILQQRLDLAIEYIYDNCFDETKNICVDDLWCEDIKNILDILKGVEE